MPSCTHICELACIGIWEGAGVHVFNLCIGHVCYGTCVTVHLEEVNSLCSASGPWQYTYVDVIRSESEMCNRQSSWDLLGLLISKSHLTVCTLQRCLSAAVSTKNKGVEKCSIRSRFLELFHSERFARWANWPMSLADYFHRWRIFTFTRAQ